MRTKIDNKVVVVMNAYEIKYESYIGTTGSLTVKINDINNAIAVFKEKKPMSIILDVKQVTL